MIRKEGFYGPSYCTGRRRGFPQEDGKGKSASRIDDKGCFRQQLLLSRGETEDRPLTPASYSDWQRDEEEDAPPSRRMSCNLRLLP